jgi:hypothetical protein
MPISEERATLAICDACGKHVWAIVGEHVPGVVGQLGIHAEWGGVPVDFFSCEISVDHVAKAASAAMREFVSGSVFDDSTPVPQVSRVNSLPVVDLPSFQVPDEIWSRAPLPDDDVVLLPVVDQLWSDLGRKPGKDRVKKACKVGERRALWLLEAVEAGRQARG